MDSFTSLVKDEYTILHKAIYMFAIILGGHKTFMCDKNILFPQLCISYTLLTISILTKYNIGHVDYSTEKERNQQWQFNIKTSKTWTRGRGKGPFQRVADLKKGGGPQKNVQ